MWWIKSSVERCDSTDIYPSDKLPHSLSKGGTTGITLFLFVK